MLSQTQAQLDKLQHNLSAANATIEQQASAIVRLEQQAAASQSVSEILRKHLHDAQQCTSEHLQRCNALEVQLSAMSMTAEQKSSDTHRFNQTVSAFEARVQERERIHGLHEKIASRQRDYDLRVKEIQQRWEASEERAGLLQQQLHEIQQNIIAEKSKQSSHERTISNYEAELKLISSSSASVDQQLRAKDLQILQLQERVGQLQQHLLETETQKSATQQQLDALKHEVDTHHSAL